MESETKELAWRQEVKKYFHSLFDIRGDMMGYEELDEMMRENTVIYGSNMWILILAILIASIGLNMNSTAVIIGAMLISPLMSGILTMGYSLAIRDLTMLRRAFIRFGTQVVISLIASTIYFHITPLDVPTSEMIARTSPTIWDVLIALFGGIAGIIGNTRQKKGNVIPGVAIATALMPPLCTAGYGIATLQLRFIVGAFYLFAINTLFIALSAALVTRLLKVPHHKELSAAKQRKINRIIIGITTVTVIPSIFVGAYTVYSTVIDRNISNYLSTEFVFADAQLVQSSVDKISGVISVSLVGTPVSDEKIAELEQKLAGYSLEGYTLHITQNRSIEGAETDADKVTIAVQERTINELQTQLEEQGMLLEQLESSMAAHIDCRKLSENASDIFTKLTGCSCGIMSDSGGEYILLMAHAKEPLTEEERQAVENWLKVQSGVERVLLDVWEDTK